MRDKNIAALLAFFLGGFGVHKFYLGQNGMGIIYLLMCWTFIPSLIAFFEFIGLLVMNTDDFNARFNPQRQLAYYPQAALPAPPQQMAQSITLHVPGGGGGGGGKSIAEQLTQLNELRIAGVLSDAEFMREKQRVLQG